MSPYQVAVPAQIFAAYLRVYRDAGPDPVGWRDATPAVLANVVRVMGEAARADLCPFILRLRLQDGQTLTVKPKRRK